MKRIAVYIRGHKRTWEYTKQNILNFCDSLAEQVDYYVAVWSSGKDNTNIFSIEKDFNGRNLRCFKIVDEHWKYDAWEGPAHLAELLGKHRLETELYGNFKYDAVLDTRFDVAFGKISDPVAPLPWHVGTTRLRLEVDIDWKGLEDHCFLMTPPTNIIWNRRIDYHKFVMVGNENGSHTKFLQYANTCDLVPYELDWFECKIVRPAIILVDQPKPNFSYISNPWIADERWHRMSIPEKIDIITRAGISLSDYLAALDLAY